MRYILILSIFLYNNSFAQTNGDTKITVTLNDTMGVYEKVKIALVKNDFMVKEDGSKDTLQTYARECTNMPGYSIARAVLINNKVILSGVYGLKKINDWGYTTSPKSYKRIIYFKGSKTWKLLMKVAETIGGEIGFSQ